jgi:uncharacterized protein
VLKQPALLKGVKPELYTDDRFGLPTVIDILSELEKPGRDPRPEFKTAVFKVGINEAKDLLPDMTLEGVVTNVTNFGAFVDVGVHQDGLVHISALADRFVKDPHDVVKAGDVVRVKVMEVDIKRKRIGLTMRLSDSREERDAEKGRPAPTTQTRDKQEDTRHQNNNNRSKNQSKNHSKKAGQDSCRDKRSSSNNSAKAPSNAMADAFAKARKK